jgi:hypothetical protein
VPTVIDRSSLLNIPHTAAGAIIHTAQHGAEYRLGTSNSAACAPT